MAFIRAADLPPLQKRDMMSALRSAARLFGTDPAQVQVDLRGLHDRFAAVLPASAGVSPARVANIRSLVLAALRQAGRRILPSRARNILSPPWATLRATLPSPLLKLGKRLRAGLSRFMHFCSREGIDPPAVDAAVFEAFRQALEQHSLVRRPASVHRTTCVLWNLAGAEVQGWPAYLAEVPSLIRKYAWTWENFPTGFVADAQAFLHHSGNQDVLSDDYAKSAAVSTLDQRRKQILQVASALLRAGFPTEDLTSLGVLVQVPNVKLAIRFLLGRHGGAPTKHLGQQVQLMRTIARHWVRADAKVVEALGQLCRNLSIKNPGMTDKNNARLQQFDNPANVQDLLGLPQQVLDQLKKQRDRGGQAGAQRTMLALAVELLTVAPMRIDNLVGLEVGRHLATRRVGGRSVMHIDIPAEETKNDVRYEVELPDGTAALLANYLAHAHRQLAPGGSAYLFPTATGGRRSTAAFATTVSQFVLREIGIVMNVHLFRHLAVKLYLDSRPEDIETMRRVLGHRSLNTTLRSYAGRRTAASFRRFDEVIASLRGPVPPRSRGPQVRRRRP